MKKILSFFVIFWLLLSMCVMFTSCGEALAPDEVIFNGQRISLTMTQEEIEELLGKGVERTSEIHFIPFDVVAYGDAFEISYIEENGTNFAAYFFIGDNSVRTNSNIAIGDTLDSVLKTYPKSDRVGGGYMVDFYHGEEVKDYGTFAYNEIYTKDRD